MNQEQLGSQKRHPVNQNPHTGETIARLRSNASAESRTHSTSLPMPSGLEKAVHVLLMASSLTVRTSYELLSKTEKLCWHVPLLASAHTAGGNICSFGTTRSGIT